MMAEGYYVIGNAMSRFGLGEWKVIMNGDWTGSLRLLALIENFDKDGEKVVQFYMVDYDEELEQTYLTIWWRWNVAGYPMYQWTFETKGEKDRKLSQEELLDGIAEAVAKAAHCYHDRHKAWPTHAYIKRNGIKLPEGVEYAIDEEGLETRVARFEVLERCFLDNAVGVFVKEEPQVSSIPPEGGREEEEDIG